VGGTSADEGHRLGISVQGCPTSGRETLSRTGAPTGSRITSPPARSPAHRRAWESLPDQSPENPGHDGESDKNRGEPEQEATPRAPELPTFAAVALKHIAHTRTPPSVSVEQSPQTG